jgi:hypothetical protein
MYNYEKYVLNEAKSSELKIGSYVLFVNDFRLYQCEGKIAVIKEIQGTGEKTRYVLEMLERPDNDGNDDDTVWKAKRTSDWDYIDTFDISRPQARKTIVVSLEFINLWKKHNVIPFECSQNFNRVLFETGFEIKINLIDTSYVDIGKNDNEVTFVPISKYKTEIKGKYVPHQSPYDANYRQSMRVSKLFKKLDPSLTEAQLEEKVNQYRLAYKNVIENAINRVRVVTGEDIRYWYLGTHYCQRVFGGTLNNSCMRHLVSQKRFNIYCENKDKCAMAIYTNKEGELLARALIWKLDNGDVYMDRIYYVNNEDEYQLRKYAKEHMMKSHFNNDQNNEKMEITLNKDFGPPSTNPYMDTFKHFDYVDKKLVNASAVKRDKYGDAIPNRYRIYLNHD